MHKGFSFKKFTVYDHRCSMKLGSDAVLLGALSDVINHGRILDIGTGCGILALMMAQRSNADIDAIEIDADASHQAAENFFNSPWSDRIRIFNISLQKYASENKERYDLIISNPPYFEKGLLSEDQYKNIARHETELGFEDLCRNTELLLNPTGTFWLILPVSEMQRFVKTAMAHHLYTCCVIDIYAAMNAAPVLVILNLSKDKYKLLEMQQFYIRNNDGSYSEEYSGLLKFFYTNL